MITFWPRNFSSRGACRRASRSDWPPESNHSFFPIPGAKRAVLSAIPRGAALPGLLRFRLPFDRHQLDVEDEGRVRPDRPCALLPVGEFGREKKLPLVADLHPPERLGPSRDDPVDREDRRLPPPVGTVELGSVAPGAPGAGLHRVGLLRRGAVARPDHLVLPTGREGRDSPPL